MKTYRSANICLTEEHLAEIVDAYLAFDEFVFDVETRGEHRGHPWRAEVAWIGLAGPGRTDVIPMSHPNGALVTPGRTERTLRRGLDGNALLDKVNGKRQFKITEHLPVFDDNVPKQLWPSKVFPALEPLFFSKKRKIGHNVRFDLQAVAQYYGKYPTPPYGDTITVVHLLNERMGRYNLEYLTKYTFELEYSDGKLGKIGIDYFDFWTVAHYLRLDVFYTWLLWQEYFPHIERQKLTSVYNLEMNLIKALLPMEKRGSLVDQKDLTAMKEDCANWMEDIAQQLYRKAKKRWDLNNHLQKGWFIYDVLGHEVQVFTEKTGQRSTKAEHLGAYRKKDPWVEKLMKYTELQKLHSVYLAGMEKHLIDGRLHPVFLPAGTETGRFSCAEPNLQNLPRDNDEREYSIRSLFIAPEGYDLIVADYSQIEYRLFAHFSDDPYMVDMFNNKVDFHTATACMMLECSPDELTNEQRNNYGKTVNFAIGYGAGPQTLSVYAGIDLKEAKKFLRKHQQGSPRFYEWKQEAVERARSRKPEPYVKTLTGRRRRIKALNAWGDNSLRYKAERQAVNTIIQGSAADLIKMAMVRCHNVLLGKPAQLILTVHDELVFEVESSYASTAEKIIQYEMEHIFPDMHVPLLVDIHTVDRWSDGKK